jgi:mitochondrial fission protein ELM1
MLKPPTIWLLVGSKPGDNAKVQAIGAALGWPVIQKHVTLLPRYDHARPRFRVSLDHLDHARSDPLLAPWPDLVIAAGRGLTMVALWIARRSDGLTRTVVIGRPRKRIGDFDLVIAARHERLPDLDNVVKVDLPFLRCSAAALESAALAWRERLADLARPITAFLVGGPTGPLRFDRRQVSCLADALGRAVGGLGTIYAATSRRTPHAALHALAGRLPGNARLYRWRPDDPDNPYLALLALADRFVVTGDSVSMLTEVARLGRPMAIAWPVRPTLWRRAEGRVRAWLHPGGGRPGQPRAPHRLLCRAGILPYPRELPALHAFLLERGHAVRLGEPWRSPSSPPEDQLPAAVERIRGLLAPRYGDRTYPNAVDSVAATSRSISSS